MDIFSKKSGPRAEDERAKSLLRKNWGTISRLADTLSDGAYSASKAKPAQPQAQGLIFVDQAATRLPDVPDPYLRISMNGRVVLVDSATNKQIQLLGQLKRVNGAVCFHVATAENGYLSPIDAEVETAIGDLAGRAIDRAFTEDDLAAELKSRLGVA